MARRVLALMLFATFVLPLCAQKKERARLQESYNVLKEVLGTPDKGIPRTLLDKSECVMVFPAVKNLLRGGGGEYGRGVTPCRSGQDLNGPWSAPAMFALEGASVGFQIG